MKTQPTHNIHQSAQSTDYRYKRLIARIHAVMEMVTPEVIDKQTYEPIIFLFGNTTSEMPLLLQKDEQALKESVRLATLQRGADTLVLAATGVATAQAPTDSRETPRQQRVLVISGASRDHPAPITMMAPIHQCHGNARALGQGNIAFEGRVKWLDDIFTERATATP